MLSVAPTVMSPYYPIMYAGNAGLTGESLLLKPKRVDENRAIDGVSRDLEIP
jgi:hypothetical protein